MIKVKENRIIMPNGINYISESEYTLEDFQFPHILDKKIPGCGYTEYCLGCPLPIILCSPRRILLENKSMQHEGDAFYFRNELDEELEVGKDLTKIVPVSKNSEESTKEDLTTIRLQDLLDRLQNYLLECQIKGIFPKILVTYDSFRLVKESLINQGIFQNFYVVIDEFQSIFTDSRFKSETEIEFVSQLQDVQQVCYVSATPMIDIYLKRVDEFKDLPYYEIDWKTEEPGRVITPDLKVRVTQSITGTANKIINEYKSGNFESAFIGDQLLYSTEAVFYVNSVNNILSIIKKAELKPEECNILCANTPQNQKKIKTRLGKDFSIGSVPLKGEPHKMFTFCTRTVYLGADFYSFCARTFILSDANIESLAVDITLDLPQILGRQRRPENPWKNRAELYYKTLKPGKSVTREDFNNQINLKIGKTNDLLLSYQSSPTNSSKNTLAETYKKMAATFNYRDDYVAVNRHGGDVLIPCLNKLVLISEERAFDIQQIDYKDRFSVFNTIRKTGLVKEGSVHNIQSFLFNFESFNCFRDKMRFLCESRVSKEEMSIILDQIPLTYKNYYLVLGSERCRALGYDVTKVFREYSDTLFDRTKLINDIYLTFQVGEKYALSVLKITLGEIYKKLGYNKSPMAVDINEFFETKPDKVMVDGKRQGALKLLKKKKGGDN